MTDLWHDVVGEGPPVVLLHAGFVDSRMWEPQVDALAERFTVVTYDQRGYGRSPRPGSTPYSPVDDLRALLDRLGLARVALVGASRGGRIAVDFALVRPDRVVALVLAASALSGHRFEVETAADLDARWEEAERTHDLAAMAEIDLEVWAPLGDAVRLREMALDNAHVNVAAGRMIEIDPPAKERLHEIRAPTLVVTGDGDVPAMAEIGDLLERGIAGARREVVPGDHFPNIRSADEFNRLVTEFLLAAA